jgi:hypothetical protein
MDLLTEEKKTTKNAWNQFYIPALPCPGMIISRVENYILYFFGTFARLFKIGVARNKIKRLPDGKFFLERKM